MIGGPGVRVGSGVDVMVGRGVLIGLGREGDVGGAAGPQAKRAVAREMVANRSDGVRYLMTRSCEPLCQTALGVLPTGGRRLARPGRPPQLRPGKKSSRQQSQDCADKGGEQV